MFPEMAFVDLTRLIDKNRLAGISFFMARAKVKSANLLRRYRFLGTFLHQKMMFLDVFNRFW